MPKSNGLKCAKCNTVRELMPLPSGLIPADHSDMTCANCSGHTFEEVFISSYWFDMAVAFGYKRIISSAALLRDLYEVWPSDKYENFADFMKAEVLA